MFKRIVTLVGLLLALSAPAALANSGTPQAAAPSRGDLQQRIDRLHDRIRKATALFRDRCESGKADPAKCKAAAEKLVDGLQKISGRIDDRVAKIKRRCDSSTSAQSIPKACSRAADVVEKLSTVQSEVQELARRLHAYLDNPPATTPASSSSSGDVAGLESLDQLAADLAAAQAAAGN
jgi:predicted phage gp36 major capsid-like protein